MGGAKEVCIGDQEGSTNQAPPRSQLTPLPKDLLCLQGGMFFNPDGGSLLFFWQHTEKVSAHISPALAAGKRTQLRSSCQPSKNTVYTPRESCEQMWGFHITTDETPKLEEVRGKDLCENTKKLGEREGEEGFWGGGVGRQQRTSEEP